MACAPFVWPRQSALSSTALASWPAPTTTSITPSVTLPSRTWGRENSEDLLDNLILQAAEQKSREDMLAALQDTSGKPHLNQQTGAWKQLKKQTSPCQVKQFMSRIYLINKFSLCRDSGTLDIVGTERAAFIATYHSPQQSKKGELWSLKNECNFLLCAVTS